MAYRKSNDIFYHEGECDFCVYQKEQDYFLEVPILVGQIIWSRSAKITKEQFELFLIDDTPAIAIADQLTEQGSKEAREELDRAGTRMREK